MREQKRPQSSCRSTCSARLAARIGIFAPLVSGLLVWACGLDSVGTVADEPETGDATSRDARSSDASSSDATTDATSSDASPGDALADALDAAADAPSTFCDTISPAPTFCADFDDPVDASPNAGWDNAAILDAGASVTLSAIAFTSAPRSLHATSTQGNAASVMRMSPMNSQVSVELDVRFTMLPATGVVAPILLTPPAYPGMDVYYFANAGGSYFQEYGDDFSPGLASPSLNVWHHIAITISTTGATSTITASIDGVFGWTNHTLLHPWPSPTTAILHVGLPRLYQVNSGEAFVDNVLVRVQ